MRLRSTAVSLRARVRSASGEPPTGAQPALKKRCRVSGERAIADASWARRACAPYGLEPVAAQVRAAGSEAIVVPCDVTDPAQCEGAAEATRRAYGRIDILVNVAGGSGPIGKTGADTTPQEFDDIVTLNMNGCFHTMRRVLPTIVSDCRGRCI